MIFEAAIPEPLAESATDHLLHSLRKGKLQEELCFALWRPSTGANRTTGLITELLLPKEHDRKQHGNVSFEAQYLARAMREACKSKSGLAFMHSHPVAGWQDMSETDIIAERDRIAPAARASGHSLLGLTVGTDGVWSARFWQWNGRAFERKECRTVKTVGTSIKLYFHPSHQVQTSPETRLRRTLDTWGVERQTLLANLRFGIVGLGSVGAIIAETLARIGATELLLVDADKIEEHNLDRMLYATSKDIGNYKVDFLATQLKKSATAASFRVDTMRSWLQEHDAYRAALDCDVLFAAVDRPLPKDLLNNIAYVHHIPVVFGGIRVATKTTGKLADATWSVTRVGSGTRCLRCGGQYTSAEVTLERDGSLDDPSYVAGHNKQPGNENVFPFSVNLGSLMVLEMLRAVLREDWWPDSSNKLHYSYVANRVRSENDLCRPGCSITERTGEGDHWCYPFLEEPVARTTELIEPDSLKTWPRRMWQAIRSLFGGGV